MAVATQAPEPVCSTNATCYFATPVWVPDNSSSATGSTAYVPSYPRLPARTTDDAACMPAGASDVTNPDSPGNDLSLDGLSVAVTPAEVPGTAVSMVGATFDVWGADALNFNTLAWNASASDVEAALKAVMPSYVPSVRRERWVDCRMVRFGGKLGFELAATGHRTGGSTKVLAEMHKHMPHTVFAQT